MFWNYFYTWMFLIYSTAVFSNVFSYINKKIIKCSVHGRLRRVWRYQRKKMLFNKYNKIRSRDNWDKYRTQRNLVNKIKRKSIRLSTSARPIVWQTGKRFRQLWCSWFTAQLSFPMSVATLTKNSLNVSATSFWSFQEKNAFNKYNKIRSRDNWDKYRTQRNLVNKIKRKSIREYFIERCVGGPKAKRFLCSWFTAQLSFPMYVATLTKKIVKCFSHLILIIYRHLLK
jgi:hypothetical protein